VTLCSVPQAKGDGQRQTDYYSLAKRCPTVFSTDKSTEAQL
jgi:hypothetical protein